MIDNIVQVSVTSPEGVEVIRIGSTGSSGISGYSGFCGRSGYSGFSARSGYSGFSGFSGGSGFSGFSGKSGYSAYSGFSGTSGYSGFCGLSGYSGFCGKSGYSGFSAASPGASGFSGFSGISGYSGFSAASPGASGYSGFCGKSGYSGYSGANPGASGYSGFSGRSGYSGDNPGSSGYSGFSGAGATGTTSKVSGSDFTTMSTSLVDITGLTFAASANKLYEINVLLRCQSSTTDGIDVGIDYSDTGATLAVTGLANFDASVGNYQTGSILTFNTGMFNAFGLVSNTDVSTWIKGVVTTGANAGNITVQVLKLVAGTATVYIGSRMTVTLLA